MSIAVAPPYGGPAAPRGGRWLLRLAVAVGALLALIQNDIIYAAIEKTPLAAQYETAERSLFGGPVFGTTRSLDRFLASTGTQLEPVRLPIAVTQFIDGQKHGSATKSTYDSGAIPPPSTSPQSDSSAQPNHGSSATNGASDEASTSNASSANSPAKAHAAKEEKPGKAVAPERASSKAVTHRSKPAPVPPASKRAPAATSSKSGVKAGGSYYDPLNGAL